MTVAVVTDSAAALPPGLAAEAGIAVVPMWLTVRGTSVHDGDRPLDDLVAEDDVSTSGPTPGEFADAIAACHDEADGVLVCTIASTMSSTYQAAELAASQAAGDVRVVDTGTAAGAEALVVLAAARAARAGRSLDECEQVALDVMRRVRLVAMVPSLDHLVRSGRVPNIAGKAGSRLGIAPLFEFRAGKVKKLRPALSADAALDRIVRTWRRSWQDDARLHVAALHAMAPDAAQRLIEKVRERVEPATAFAGEFGTVMVVHTGPGLAGLAWWWEPEA